jgi:sugar/nucleoside kinase (ribokinase family)
MVEVLIMGEMLCEIMREKEDVELFEEGMFLGPYPSGAPAIFIDTVARLGHKAAIIGGVGKDDFGKCILERLKKDGVDCSHVLESEEKATGVAFVTYFKDGSRKFIFHMGNTPAVEAKAPREDAFTDVKYMHIMGCSLMSNKDFAQEILKTMKMVVSNGTKISFDPNIRKELFTDGTLNEVVNEVMNHTSVFLPGVEELLTLTESKSVDEAIKKCFEKPKMEIIALKNGSKGSTIYTKDKKVFIEVYKAKQIDATGAGDCFDAGFIAGLLEGKDVVEAAKMAAAAGALNVAAFGPMEGKISRENLEITIKEKQVR